MFSTSEIRMKRVSHHLLTVAAAFAVALGASADATAVDAAAAQQLARQSNCLKCHAVDRKKEGPSYKDVAAKYKGKPDARATVFHHVTSGDKVKFEDGHEEEHAVVKTKEKDKIDNLVDWILAQ
jgi:cytochrome c